MDVQAKISQLTIDAINKYSMIGEDDKILVAFSGGKDSYTLLDMLLLLLPKSKNKYKIFVVMIDSGFGCDFSKAERYLKDRRVEYLIAKKKISSVLDEKMPREEKTGKICFLCSRLRRGALYRIAYENKCNKIALGHNLDDAIETYLLNIFFVANRKIMRPNYKAVDSKNIIIRPLINVPESLIKTYAAEKKFPIVKQKCKYRGSDSKRKMVKGIMQKLSHTNKYLYPSMAKVLGDIYYNEENFRAETFKNN